jgi:hypothetical protein
VAGERGGGCEQDDGGLLYELLRLMAVPGRVPGCVDVRVLRVAEVLPPVASAKDLLNSTVSPNEEDLIATTDKDMNDDEEEEDEENEEQQSIDSTQEPPEHCEAVRQQVFRREALLLVDESFSAQFTVPPLFSVDLST